MTDPLVLFLQSKIGKGATCIRARGSDLSYSLGRDLANAMPILIKDALLHTHFLYGAADSPLYTLERLKAVDKIGSFMALVHNLGLSNNKEGIQHLSEMLDAVGNTEDGRLVLHTFLNQLALALIAYNYASHDMGIGAASRTDESALTEHTLVHSLLGQLRPETRAQVILELQEAAALPSNIDWAPLRRRVENFSDLVDKVQLNKMQVQE